MKKWIAGVDIGGTKISVVLGRPSGRIASKRVFPAYPDDAEKSCRAICDVIRSALKAQGSSPEEVEGVGICAPGQIDVPRGVIVTSPNLPGWRNVEIRKRIGRAVGLRVEVENDANAAALGEKCFGAGKGIEDFIYVTVSTGIGSGIIANGSLVHGASGVAGEIGHMTVVMNGNACGCGKRGCLEAHASGTAMAKACQKALSEGCRSRYFARIETRKITGETVAQAAKMGDRLAIGVRREAAGYLGFALGNVINLLNPSRVILGGGVMTSVHHFWEPMIEAVRREAWPFHYQSCKIMRTKLAGRAGDLGAMALVMGKK